MLSFDSRAAAEEWVIRNQFGRRNLAPYQRAELALKLEDAIAARAKANQGQRTDLCPTLDKSSEPVNTLEEMSSTAGVSRATMHKAKVIAAEADEDTKAALRAGEKTISAEYERLKKPHVGITAGKMNITQRNDD